MKRLEQDPRFPEYRGNIIVWARDMTRKLVETLREVYDIIGRDDEGLWTPTGAAVANVTTVTTAEGFFFRKRNHVHCSGTFTLQPTAGATQTTLTLSLPTVPNFTSALQARGGAVRGGTGVVNIPAVILATVGAQTVTVSFLCDADNASRGWSYWLDYQEIP